MTLIKGSDGVVSGLAAGVCVGCVFSATDCGLNGTISRRIVEGTCAAAARFFPKRFGGTNETTCCDDRRLFTRISSTSKPSRKRVSAPVGDLKKLIKRRGVIAVAVQVQCLFRPAD